MEAMPGIAGWMLGDSRVGVQGVGLEAYRG